MTGTKKKNPANIAKSYLADYSAAAVTGVYYSLQGVLETLPDLPRWVAGLVVLLALVRAVVLQWLADRDGDGEPDYTLGLDQLKNALREGKLDAGEVKDLVDQHQGSDN